MKCAASFRSLGISSLSTPLSSASKTQRFRTRLARHACVPHTKPSLRTSFWREIGRTPDCPRRLKAPCRVDRNAHELLCEKGRRCPRNRLPNSLLFFHLLLAVVNARAYTPPRLPQTTRFATSPRFFDKQSTIELSYGI